MPVAGLLKLIPSILRIGGVLSLFFLGWHSKGVLVENKELNKIKKELEASNQALALYQTKVQELGLQLSLVEKELNRDETESCNTVVAPCVRTVIDRLYKTRN